MQYNFQKNVDTQSNDNDKFINCVETKTNVLKEKELEYTDKLLNINATQYKYNIEPNYGNQNNISLPFYVDEKNTTDENNCKKYMSKAFEEILFESNYFSVDMNNQSNFDKEFIERYYAICRKHNIIIKLINKIRVNCYYNKCLFAADLDCFIILYDANDCINVILLSMKLPKITFLWSFNRENYGEFKDMHKLNLEYDELSTYFASIFNSISKQNESNTIDSVITAKFKYDTNETNNLVHLIIEEYRMKRFFTVLTLIQYDNNLIVYCKNLLEQYNYIIQFSKLLQIEYAKSIENLNEFNYKSSMNYELINKNYTDLLNKEKEYLNNISRLGIEIDMHKSNEANSKIEYELMVNKYQQLAREHANNEIELKEANKKLLNSSKVIEKQKSEIDELKELVKQSNEDCEKIATKLSNYDKKYSSLKQYMIELEDKNNIICESQLKIKKLEEKLIENEKLISTMREDEASYFKDMLNVKQLKSSISTAESRLKEYENTLMQNNQQIDKYKDEIKLLKNFQNQLISDNERLKKEMRELNLYCAKKLLEHNKNIIEKSPSKKNIVEKSLLNKNTVDNSLLNIKSVEKPVLSKTILTNSKKSSKGSYVTNENFDYSSNFIDTSTTNNIHIDLLNSSDSDCTVSNETETEYGNFFA